MGAKVWIKELTGNANYSQWKYDMENLQAEHDLHGHCDNSYVKPQLAAAVFLRLPLDIRWTAPR